MFDTTNAACKDMPTEMFFPPSGKTPSAKIAKEVCNTCEIRVQCLQWALANNEFGIWGGTTTEERNVLKRSPAKRKLLLRDITNRNS